MKTEVKTMTVLTMDENEKLLLKEILEDGLSHLSNNLGGSEPARGPLTKQEKIFLGELAATFGLPRNVEE